MLLSFKPEFRPFLALALFLLSGCAPQQVGKKIFVVVGASGKTLHHHHYEPRTMLEVIESSPDSSDEETQYVAGRQGTGALILTSPTNDVHSGTDFQAVYWDWSTNLPIYSYDPSESSSFTRYLHFVTRKLGTLWGFVPIFIGFTLLLLLALKATAKPGERFLPESLSIAFPIGLVCLGGAFVGHPYSVEAANQAHMVEQLKAYVLPDGHILPFPFELVQQAAFYPNTIYDTGWGAEIWQLFFWGSHFVALLCIPLAARQLFKFGFYSLYPRIPRKLIAGANTDDTPARGRLAMVNEEDDDEQKDDKPRALELLHGGGALTRLPPPEPGVLETISDPQRWVWFNTWKAEATRAHDAYLEAAIKHDRTQAKLDDVEELIAKDRAIREAEKLEAERRVRAQKTLDHELRIKNDQLAVKGRELTVKKLELDEKIAALKNPPLPPKPPDPVAETAASIRRMILSQLKRVYTKAEIARQAAGLKEEYLRSVGGKITDQVRLMLDNIDDAAQALMDDLDK